MAPIRALRALFGMLILLLSAPLLSAGASAKRSDFNGDGKSDLLWRNSSTGQVYLMPINGASVLPGTIVWTETNPAWQIVGTGDFDGDGKADILWWNSSTGQVFQMLMNGSTVNSSALIYTEPNTAWKIQAVADFDGDGKADLLWRNSTTGQVYLMPMNGTTVLPGNVVWTETNPAWQIVGTGDFDGDGKADILWWNSSTGQVFQILMIGTTVKASALIYTESNTEWRIVGTGDFNGDGRADILWRNSTTGQVYLMPVFGASALPGGIIWTEPNMAWQILAIGDFNGDGKDDIIWRNSGTGQIFQVLLNGLAVQSSALVYTEANTAWTLQCGGGRISTLSGTAAAGGAIIGTVTIKDSSTPAKSIVAPIQLDGTYTTDVSGLTPPFMLRADGVVAGHAYSLYSAGVAADVNGTVNITPLTDLILANLAGDIASNYYAAGSFAGLSTAALNAKAAILQAQLSPVLAALGVSSGLDLLHASFATNHMGMDAVLDALNVSVDPITKVATIQNILNGSSFTNNLTSGATSGALTGTGTAGGLTTIQSITNRFTAFNSLCATSVPTRSQVLALGLFDSTNFLFGGQDFDGFVMNQLLGAPGVQFISAAVEPGGVTPNAMWINFGVAVNGAFQGNLRWLFTYDATSSSYLARGDQRQVQADLEAHANYLPGNPGQAIFTGLLLTVKDPTNYMGTSGYAVLTGPGITSKKFVKDISISRLTQGPAGSDTPNIYMTDAQLASCPDTNVVYTLSLYNGSSALLTQYALTVPKRSALTAELSPNSFIAAQSVTPGNLVGFTGGTITATWTVPSGLNPGWFFAGFSDATTVRSTQADGMISADGKAGTVTFPSSSFAGWSAAHGFSFVGGTDLFGRAYETRLVNF